MVDGAWHHAVHAHAGQCSAQEQSVLRSGAFYLSARKQQLSLSGGEQLNYVGLNVTQSAHAYIGSAQTLRGMFAKSRNAPVERYKYLAIHIHEPARQRARELANTPAFAQAQRQRKKVEALFAELKNQIGLRRLRLRRMKFVREQFFLAAAAQNIKRLVRFLSQPITPNGEATT